MDYAAPRFTDPPVTFDTVQVSPQVGLLPEKPKPSAEGWRGRFRPSLLVKNYPALGPFAVSLLVVSVLGGIGLVEQGMKQKGGSEAGLVPSVLESTAHPLPASVGATDLAERQLAVERLLEAERRARLITEVRAALPKFEGAETPTVVEPGDRERLKAQLREALARNGYTTPGRSEPGERTPGGETRLVRDFKEDRR